MPFSLPLHNNGSRSAAAGQEVHGGHIQAGLQRRVHAFAQDIHVSDATLFRIDRSRAFLFLPLVLRYYRSLL